ncbi:MAG TPA: helix-turn-helix domain-containing protein [Candidatus Limnocylindrales bacterium]|nr:helix-turn-helix domain-containing protein [Candidatus Limnocylindrales bacterium]
MGEYGQYCPVAKGAEIFAERWTPLVIRNLYLDCHSFSEILAGVPHMSRTLLAQRLRTLEGAGIVESRSNPKGRGSLYFLTSAGQELSRVCIELGTWAARWLDLRPQDMDPYVVLWAWMKFIKPERLPNRRVVLRFDLKDRPKERFWLLLDRRECEVCIKPPGFEEDIVVRTDCETLTLVHVGRVSLAEAVRSGRWEMDGPRQLLRALPSWGGLSYFADVQPAVEEAAAR